MSDKICHLSFDGFIGDEHEDTLLTQQGSKSIIGTKGTIKTIPSFYTSISAASLFVGCFTEKDLAEISTVVPSFEDKLTGLNFPGYIQPATQCKIQVKATQPDGSAAEPATTVCEFNPPNVVDGIGLAESSLTECVFPASWSSINTLELSILETTIPADTAAAIGQVNMRLDDFSYVPKELGADFYQEVR